MNKLFIVILSLFILSSCTTRKVVDIKSPCVSNEDGGPCGPRKSINNWWLEQKNQS